MNEETDWMKDLNCLQAFAEKYESLFEHFILEYEQDLLLAKADHNNDLERDELE